MQLIAANNRAFGETDMAYETVSQSVLSGKQPPMNCLFESTANSFERELKHM